jgi:putative MFS transporter
MPSASTTTAAYTKEDDRAYNQCKQDAPPALSTWGLLCAGTVWAISAMELIIFTFTRECVEHDIGMGTFALELLSAATPLGFIIGGPLFGFVADVRGRRMALLVSMTLALLGLGVSAGARTDVEVLTTRVVASIGLGGEVPAAVVLVYELAPLGRRTSAVALLHAFAAVGSVVGLVLALFVTPVIGWRALYLSLSALLLFVAVVRLGLPESPLWLASKERVDKPSTLSARHDRASISDIQSGEEFQAVIIDEGLPSAMDSPDSSSWVVSSTPRDGELGATKIEQSPSIASFLALFLLWMVLDVCEFALGSYVPTLISFVGFNVYGSWCTCIPLYALPFFGSVLASLLLNRRQWWPHVRFFASVDRMKSTLALFSIATAVFAVCLSYIPWSWTIVTTGASLVSTSLSGVWSAVLAYTAEHFSVSKRARGVGVAVGFRGAGGVLGALVLFPRVYDVWMVSVPAITWTFGGALVTFAAVIVHFVGPPASHARVMKATCNDS